ncbi:MAG: dihydroorotase family protein [Patescibacteria group bacterium]
MSLQTFPGFIDVHVHLREPGATHKEDFYTGSRAAIKGGFTFIIDMPNNPTPTITVEKLKEKLLLSKKGVCGIGFHYGTNGKNIATFSKIWNNKNVFGLKLYCNHTTGEMLIEDLGLLEKVFEAWESDKPILVHAEGVQLAAAISLAFLYGRRLHVCHISQAIEVELVRKAKAKKLKITAGVCPHHLFMTEKNKEKQGALAMMKPPLGTQVDQDELWNGILDGTIDIVETDHAPHTLKEKQGDPAPFGVPGLETAVGLLFKAVKEKKIPLKMVKKLLYTQPKKIFNIPDQLKTYVQLDPDKPWILGEDKYESKCGWSPFDGWELYGKPQLVVFKGKTIVEDGRIR